MTLGSVTSFPGINILILGGISFHGMAENWKDLKDTLAFSSFLVC